MGDQARRGGSGGRVLRSTYQDRDTRGIGLRKSKQFKGSGSRRLWRLMEFSRRKGRQPRHTREKEYKYTLRTCGKDFFMEQELPPPQLPPTPLPLTSSLPFLCFRGACVGISARSRSPSAPAPCGGTFPATSPTASFSAGAAESSDTDSRRGTSLVPSPLVGVPLILRWQGDFFRPPWSSSGLAFDNVVDDADPAGGSSQYAAGFAFGVRAAEVSANDGATPPFLSRFGPAVTAERPRETSSSNRPQAPLAAATPARAANVLEPEEGAQGGGALLVRPVLTPISAPVAATPVAASSTVETSQAAALLAPPPPPSRPLPKKSSSSRHAGTEAGTEAASAPNCRRPAAATPRLRPTPAPPRSLPPSPAPQEPAIVSASSSTVSPARVLGSGGGACLLGGGRVAALSSLGKLAGKETVNTGNACTHGSQPLGECAAHDASVQVGKRHYCRLNNHAY